MNELMCRKSNGKIPDGLILLRLFPGSLHRNLKPFVLPRLLPLSVDSPVFTFVPGHAHSNLSSLSPKIKFLFLIRRVSDKTSELDPIPTWLVRECADIIAPLAHVFNDSLLTRYLPADQKRVIINFTQVSRSPCLTLMTWLAIVPSRILAFRFTCWKEVSMPIAQLRIFLDENELLPYVKSCKTKDKLYKKYQQFPTSENKQSYCAYKNQYTAIKRKAEKSYFQNKLDQTKGDLRKTWQVIKDAIN